MSLNDPFIWSVLEPKQFLSGVLVPLHSLLDQFEIHTDLHALFKSTLFAHFALVVNFTTRSGTLTFVRNIPGWIHIAMVVTILEKRLALEANQDLPRLQQQLPDCDTEL